MSRQSGHIHFLLGNGEVFTACDAVKAGVSHQSMLYHCKAGHLVRLAHGVYVSSEKQMSDQLALSVLQRKGTEFVVCLASALRLHGLTTQNPQALWVALPQGARRPSVSFPLEAVHLGKETYDVHVQEFSENGRRLKLYSPARTVADCFRFRNRIGLDVALEALKDGWRKRAFTMDELYEAANVCRVWRVMSPYAEMMVQ